MTIERASPQAVSKPWGSTDLRPWSVIRQDGAPVGELWFERNAGSAPDPALLVKLLFTTAALSIQVHPDDAFARSIGLPRGKSEAWYILAAAKDAKVALGLRQLLDATQLRHAISDGSIVDLVEWSAVRTGDFLTVPAGTIHAIGAGLVIAEIQQRSDATFRLFDFGRHRELQVEYGVAAARAGPAEEQAEPLDLSPGRTLLAANPHFITEKVDLPPLSTWRLRAPQETWLLAIAGSARIGELEVRLGQALYLEGERSAVQAGQAGFQALIAYPGPALNAELLQEAGATATTQTPAQLAEVPS